MKISPQQVIISRVLRELHDGIRVVLGKGIPQLLAPHLADSIEVVEPGANGHRPDVCIVEAAEVARDGGILLAHSEDAECLGAGRCLVVTRQCNELGEPRLVEECSRPADCSQCAALIVTELAVIEVNDVGFELRELAPGVASDDVRARVRASLHVSDSIQNMLL